MEQDIINLQQYADALRNTGYKNVESAIAEIVDNSLEARVSDDEVVDILIIASSKVDPNSGNKYIDELAFLDNGTGMDKELVQSCLRIGYGTRARRKGMGRFGVGLPQSSMYTCPLVEVFSWTHRSEECYKSFLDIEKIKNGEQNKFQEPEKTVVPEKYKKFISCRIKSLDLSFGSHGTLVIWKSCDRVTYKKVVTLFDHLQLKLGQKFRHWIHDKKCRLILLDLDNSDNIRVIRPNDPLLLMEDNYALGNPQHPTELKLPRSFENNDLGFIDPIFEPFRSAENQSGIVKHSVKYIDNQTGKIKTGEVTIKFSVVKKEYFDQTAIPQRNPGDFNIGKFVKDLEGISIVRAGREIDFRRFDFYENVNEPNHRWWGCEISFEPELDEVFGVANNKQQVELGELEPSDYDDHCVDGEPVLPVWFQLDMPPWTRAGF